MNSKKLITFILWIVLMFYFVTCRAKHSFQTREGRKKLDHYNSIQYDGAKKQNKKKEAPVLN